MIPLIESLEAAIAFYAQNPTGECIVRAALIDRRCKSLAAAKEFLASVLTPSSHPSGPGVANVQVELVPFIKPPLMWKKPGR